MDIVDKRSTEGLLRPTGFKFVQRHDTRLRRGGQRGGRGRVSQDRGSPDSNLNASPDIDQEQEHNEQDVDACIGNGDKQGSASRAQSSTRGERRGGRGSRGDRGNVGRRGRNNTNTSNLGHQNEGHVVIGTLANENGRYHSSRGESSGRGKGREITLDVVAVVLHGRSIEHCR